MRKLLISAVASSMLFAAGPAMARSAMHGPVFVSGERVTQTNECRVVARWIDPYDGSVYEQIQCVIYESGRV